MKRIRIDVDTQVGFCLPNGNLYVPSKDGTLENIRALVADAGVECIPLLGSVDSHSHDAWEFIENGGPFPAHCVKGTSDWLKIDGTLPKKFRFIPMTAPNAVVVGETVQGTGNRSYGSVDFANEAINGVGIYFEKEVYSAFANPNAEIYIDWLVEMMGGKANVTFQVFGYCTGGFCVDGFVTGLLSRGYKVQVIEDACAPINGVNGPDGAAYSRDTLTKAGATFITTDQAING